MIHDDSAFYTFLLAILSSYVGISIIYIVIKCANFKRKEKRKFFSLFFCFNFLFTAIAFWMAYHLVGFIESGGAFFDPYEILGVSERASVSQIKKAYRRLGQKHHPDKNQGDRKASIKFTKIAKAYEALTDKNSMENYRKYGHPDGRQAFSVAVGLPSFLNAEGNSNFVLVSYGVLIVVLIPGLFFGLYTSSRNVTLRDRKYVSKETQKLFYETINDDCFIEDIFVLLAETQELQGINQHTEIPEVVLTHLKKNLPTHTTKKLDELTQPRTKYIYAIIMCHFSRQSLPENTLQALQEDIQLALFRIPSLLEVMAEISFVQSRLEVTKTIYRLLPLFAQGVIKVSLQDIEEQKRKQLPKIDMKVNMEVLDEEDIQCYDLVTCTIDLKKMQSSQKKTRLPSPESSSFLHEEDLQEAYWLIVADISTNSILAVQKITNLNLALQATTQFYAPQLPGKYQTEFRLISTVYLDFEVVVECTLDVVREEEDSSVTDLNG